VKQASAPTKSNRKRKPDSKKEEKQEGCKIQKLCK